MYRFFLFRILMRPKKARQSLFNANKGQLIKKLITSCPRGEVRKGVTWVIASNWKSLANTDGIYFEFGRIVEKEKNAFDNDQKLFIHQEGEEVESTICFYFPTSQLLAIRSGNGITVDPKVISKYLSKVLSQASSEQLSPEESVIFETHTISSQPIKNPENFFQRLRSAYKVSKFTIVFGYPNPFNFRAKIQKPMQDFQKAALGEQCKYTVSNKKEGLDIDILEDASRGASILDHNVSARVHTSEKDIQGSSISMRNQTEDAQVDIESDDYEDRIEAVGQELSAFFESLAPREEL